MIRIKSITEVITNSSTEVYTIYEDGGIDRIKELINLMFKMSKLDVTFEDIFDVVYEIDRWQLMEAFDEWSWNDDVKEILNKYVKNTNDEENETDDDSLWVDKIPYEEQLKVARLYDDDACGMRPPSIEGFYISVKEKLPIDIDKELLEEILDKIDDGMFFDTVAVTS